MAILIGHAVMDENGGIDGAIAGDQTGKEIATRQWYKRTKGWHTYLEPTDRTMGKKAAQFMREICANNNYGYSQPNRWTGAKSIEILGVANGHGDFDCSSLCIECYRLAGLNHKMSGYTGSMVKSLLATGKFKAHTEAAYLSSGDYAITGGLFVGEGHVCMALEDGPKASKAPADDSTPVKPTPAPTYDVEPPYVTVVYGSVYVREGAGKEYPKMFVAKKGQKFPFLEIDEDTGWYWIDTVKGIGCITGKPKYTALIVGEE